MIDFRDKHNISQEELSLLTGISVSKISKYERGIYDLSATESKSFEKIKSLSQVEIKEKLVSVTDNNIEVKTERFEIDGHCIFLGDAIEVLQDEIPDNSVDLIFVDPPYNIGKRFESGIWENEQEYINWCYRWLDLLIDKLSDNGTMYLMAATQYMPYFDLYLREKMHILSRIVWYYDSSGRQAKNYYGSLYEPILHMVKNQSDYTFNSEEIMVEAKTGAKRQLIDYRKDPPQPYNTRKVPGNVWEFPRVRYRMDEYEKHPSQKPENLLERIILASSNRDDTVLDPFAGTFTTNAVSKRLQRNSIGIEIKEDYVKIGLRRLNIAKKYKGEQLRPVEKTY